jgi:hypothetical protein
MKPRLTVVALESAIARRGEVAGCVVHSDRGSPAHVRADPPCGPCSHPRTRVAGLVDQEPIVHPGGRRAANLTIVVRSRAFEP